MSDVGIRITDEEYWTLMNALEVAESKFSTNVRDLDGVNNTLADQFRQQIRGVRALIQKIEQQYERA